MFSSTSEYVEMMIRKTTCGNDVEMMWKWSWYRRQHLYHDDVIIMMVSSSWWYHHELYPYDESWWAGRSAVVHCVHGENLGIPKMRGADFLDAQSRTSRNAQSLIARLFVCLLCAYSFALWISVVGLFACCLFVCLFVVRCVWFVCSCSFVWLIDWLILFFCCCLFACLLGDAHCGGGRGVIFFWKIWQD